MPCLGRLEDSADANTELLRDGLESKNPFRIDSSLKSDVNLDASSFTLIGSPYASLYVGITGCY